VKPLLLALCLALPAAPHDFFISILTIRHSPDTRTLDLTWRITAHDIEHALENVGDLKLGSPKEHPKADSLLNAYFQEHLHLSKQGAPLTWRWIGKELESENLYCYLQVNSVPDDRAIGVDNTLLFDVFLEQQNVTHFETPAGIQTYAQVRDRSGYTFNP
jgi:hypothetical protein